MSELRIFDEAGLHIKTMSAHSDISMALADIGVRFERWQTGMGLDHDAPDDEVIEAYHEQVDALMQEYNFLCVDVISLQPGHPDAEALRKKFLDEHAHSDFEVRFFVEGKGLFYIHEGEYVYGVLCGAGDLISIPDNMLHWFDMGSEPSFKCIRLFSTPEGWMASYSGNDIATGFPLLDEFTAGKSAG